MEILGGVFFLITAAYILKDKAKVEEAIAGKNKKINPSQSYHFASHKKHNYFPWIIFVVLYTGVHIELSDSSTTEKITFLADDWETNAIKIYFENQEHFENWVHFILIPIQICIESKPMNFESMWFSFLSHVQRLFVFCDVFFSTSMHSIIISSAMTIRSINRFIFRIFIPFTESQIAESSRQPQQHQYHYADNVTDDLTWETTNDQLLYSNF